MIGSAFGPGDTAFAVMRDVLGAIEDRLHAVRSDVEKRRSLADATPSIWPVAGWLTSSFGNRRDPFNGGSDFHPGLDISASQGDPVLAPAAGKSEPALVMSGELDVPSDRENKPRVMLDLSLAMTPTVFDTVDWGATTVGADGVVDLGAPGNEAARTALLEALAALQPAAEVTRDDR